jgi:hypothetical protein
MSFEDEDEDEDESEDRELTKMSFIESRNIPTEGNKMTLADFIVASAGSRRHRHIKPKKKQRKKRNFVQNEPQEYLKFPDKCLGATKI